MARDLYFTYNEKQYECGTVIVLKNDYPETTYERVFLCYIPSSDSYLYQKKDGGAIRSMEGRDFRNNIIEVKDEICFPIRDSFLKSTSGTVGKNFVRDNPVGAQGLFYLFLLVICVACPPLSIFVVLFALLYNK